MFFRITPKTIKKLHKNREVGKLIPLLGYENEEVRREAASALGEIGDQQAVNPLIGALKDDHPQVREAAAKALGMMRDNKAIEPLIAALDDDRIYL